MSFGMPPTDPSDPPGSYLDDDEHEFIESPAALYRHLYEDHHVQEARDLDPETAPVQFWLRRHAELERAARREAARAAREAAVREPDILEDAVPEGAAPERAAQQGAARDVAARETGARAAYRPEPPADEDPEGRASTFAGSRRPPARRPPARGGDHRPPARGPYGQERAQDRRHDRMTPTGGRDPLLDAVVDALVRAGHDERAVRRLIRTYPGPDGEPAGPDGFRRRFLRPMLEAVGRELATMRRPPEPTPSPPRPAPAPRPGPEPRHAAASRPEDDVMALANAVQRPHVRHARATHSSVYKLDDDVMALADAVQRRDRR